MRDPWVDPTVLNAIIGVAVGLLVVAGVVAMAVIRPSRAARREPGGWNDTNNVSGGTPD